jgi:hypothetical protein
VPEGVVCRAGDGAEIRFSVSSVEAYSDDQARAFATAQDLGPEGDSADAYAGTDDYPDDNGSPGDYSDDSGSDSYNLSPVYGQNIPNYDEGNGYRVQCADGMYSQSGGIQGACSGHGGVG